MPNPLFIAGGIVIAVSLASLIADRTPSCRPCRVRMQAYTPPANQALSAVFKIAGALLTGGMPRGPLGTPTLWRCPSCAASIPYREQFPWEGCGCSFGILLLIASMLEIA